MSSSLVEPRQLKRIRTQLGYTQGRLAKAAGVSQSIIAKIEAGSVDPTFGTLAAITKALSAGNARRTQRAADVMSSPVVGVQDSASLRDCVDVMKRKGFSQLPVFADQRLVGTITESHVMALLSSAKDPRRLLEEKAGGHILPAFAMVGKDTPVEALFSLFRYLPAILVASGDKVDGIITKIDLLAARA